MSALPPDLAEDPWIQFLSVAIAGIREAARRVTGELRPTFEARDGWYGRPRASLRGARVPSETSISGALVQVLKQMRMRQLVEGEPAPPGLDLARMEFEVEVPRRIERGIGPKSQPTDLMIAVAQDNLDLRIEAKNLLSDAEIRGEYLGERGLRRFDDVRSPYSAERYGAMLAYVMDRDCPSWAEAIRRALVGADPPFRVRGATIGDEQFTATLHDRVIDSPEHGVHERRTTEVLHLVLEFEADPTLRRPPIDVAE